MLCLLCGEGILQIPREGVIAADRGGGTGILLLSEIGTKYLDLFFLAGPSLIIALPCKSAALLNLFCLDLSKLLPGFL